MNRAVLLIGVSQTGGGLGKLQAVESSIDRMQAWARAQGIPDAQIIRRTDATGPVTVADLFKDVQALVELDTVEQLIVYFAGHGVVNNRQEYWLLSDAPVNAAAAINLDGNVSLARAGAFAHVVFLSDACRTPTTGVQYGRIIGSDIFPNITDAELERPVDIFFGTALGAPALEVIQAGAGQKYQAIYTEALLDALNGKIPEAVSQWPRATATAEEIPAAARQRKIAGARPGPCRRRRRPMRASRRKTMPGSRISRRPPRPRPHHRRRCRRRPRRHPRPRHRGHCSAGACRSRPAGPPRRHRTRRPRRRAPSRRSRRQARLRRQANHCPRAKSPSSWSKKPCAAIPSAGRRRRARKSAP